jgi:hypothetical protein
MIKESLYPPLSCGRGFLLPHPCARQSSGRERRKQSPLVGVGAGISGRTETKADDVEVCKCAGVRSKTPSYVMIVVRPCDADG